MIRISIDLTDAQHEGLRRLAKATGKSRSKLAREAIDAFVNRYHDAVIDAVVGMWKGRDDLPDLRALRKQWDRKLT